MQDDGDDNGDGNAVSNYCNNKDKEINQNDACRLSEIFTFFCYVIMMMMVMMVIMSQGDDDYYDDDDFYLKTPRKVWCVSFSPGCSFRTS